MTSLSEDDRRLGQPGQRLQPTSVNAELVIKLVVTTRDDRGQPVCAVAR
jgi:hypothetical protein